MKNSLGLEKLTLNWKFYFKVKNLLWIEKFTLNWKNCSELKKLLWIKKFTLNWIIHNERKDQSVYAGWLWKILTVADLYYTTSSDTDSVAYLPTYRYMFKFSFKKPFYFQKLLYRYCSNYPLSRNCAIEAFNHKKNNVEGKIYHYIRFGNEMWVKRKHTSETLTSPAVCTYYILYIMLSNRLISYMID